VGIGCGTLLLLGMIAFAGAAWWGANKIKDFAENPEKLAEMIISANPDVEVVSTDKGAGTITVRDKATGEETVLNLSDIQQGKIDIKTKDGTVKMDGTGVTMTDEEGQTSTFSAGAGTGDVPDWVPAYPGSEAQGTGVADTPEGKGGMVTIKTTDSVDKVVKFYEDKLKADGYTVQQSTSTANGTMSGAMVSGSTEGEARTVTIMAGPMSDGSEGTEAVVTFSEKK
jgi:hypothetical protein